MTEPRVVVSFKGCKTRAEALARINAFLDDHYREQERAICADWIIADGEYCNATEFADEVAQLRASFEANREECLQVCLDAFTKLGLP